MSGRVYAQQEVNLYSAIAMGQKVAGFASGYGSEEVARKIALQKCAKKNKSPCYRVTSEKSNWYYSAGLCQGQPFTGATPRGQDGQGFQNADERVRKNAAAAGFYNCIIVEQQ